MKFLLSVILIAVLGFLSGLFLPWWGIAVAAFAGALLVPQGGGRHFLAGFIALLMLWGGIALLIDLANKSILSQKMAQLFPLGGSSTALILVTAVVGALVGGLAAWTGGSLRNAINYRR